MPKKKIEEPKEGELIPIATISQSVIESYLFATGRQNLSIYSERLLLQLVKVAQKQVLGLNFKSGRDIRQVEIGRLGERVIEIDARSILGSETSKNYSHAKNAVLELMSKQISHERPKTRNGVQVYNPDGSPMYEFEAHTLVNDVYINRKPGTIIVNVNKTTWETLLDFSKGFRRYDLQMAMSFSHSCTLRLYKLVSGQKHPLQYTLKELREQWNLEDKYKNNNDFVRYTIDAAKKELDPCSPWTFEYELVSNGSSGKRGRRTLNSVIFYPVHQPQFDSTSSVSKMVHPKDILGGDLINVLVKLGFSMAQIKAHTVLFKTAMKYFDLVAFIDRISPSAERALTTTQGYVVNAVKHHLLEDYNVKVTKGQILTEDAIIDNERKDAVPEEKRDTDGCSSAAAEEQPRKRAPEAAQPARKSETVRKKGEPQSMGNLLQGLFD